MIDDIHMIILVMIIVIVVDYDDDDDDGGGGVERSSNLDDGRDFLCIFFVIVINLSSLH